MRACAVVAVAGLLLAGCAEGDPGAGGDVESLGELVPGPVAEELTESGRCGDGVLWAADASGSLVVTVSVPAGGPDEAVLPSEEVVVEALHGEGLVPEPCAADADVASRSPAAQGRVSIERDRAGCATGFRIDGLEADDGTTFPPIEGGAGVEGCAAG